MTVSCFFYGWLDWRFLILLFDTLVSTWWSGNQIAAQLSRSGELGKKKARMFLLFNRILNIGILGLFKYYNFFADSFSALLQFFGFHAKSAGFAYSADYLFNTEYHLNKKGVDLNTGKIIGLLKNILIRSRVSRVNNPSLLPGYKAAMPDLS